jgi:hypothetical protein
MVVLSIEAPEFVPSEIPRKERDAKLSLSPLKLNASPIDQAFTDREVLQPVDEERVFAAFDQLPWTPGTIFHRCDWHLGTSGDDRTGPRFDNKYLQASD